MPFMRFECIPSQPVRGDKMSDDAKFILGFG